MLLARFVKIDYVIINRVYLRCLSLNQGQNNLDHYLLHIFIRQMLY